MSRLRSLALARSWFGLLAVAVALSSGAWLAGQYVYAVSVTKADTARIASLKERARTDPAVAAQALQPEFDRQRDDFQRRVRVYRRGSLVLLASIGAFMVWLRWLKPGPGEWVAVPGRLAAAFDGVFPPRDAWMADKAPRPKRKVKKGALAGPRLTAAERVLTEYRVLDSCSGCTVCAQVCPLNAIEARPYLKHEIIDGKCTRCGLCVPACPEHAIEVVQRDASPAPPA